MKKYTDKFLLKNRVAFVTGGLGLLGKEIIHAFAEAQAKTIILDIDRKKGESLENKMRALGFDVFYEFFDVTDLPHVDEHIENLAKKYNGIDVWVNAAYPKTSDWRNKVEDLSLDSWRKNVDMHLNSYSWISRKVCLMMKSRKSGSVINFGSIYGVLGSDFNIYKNTNMTTPMAYAAIKGGIINLTRYLASYFGPYNIRVNSICPGGVVHAQKKNFVKNYADRTPLRRLAKPQEIATVTLFLASEAASYITGSTLMVDGGWSAI